MSDITYKSYIPQTIKAIESGGMDGLIKLAARVITETKSLAQFGRYQTGNLRNSYMWKTKTESDGYEGGGKLKQSAGTNEVIMGSGSDHATYVEMGTRKMTAQPHFRVALDIILRGANAAKAMSEALANSVKKVVKQ